MTHIGVNGEEHKAELEPGCSGESVVFPPHGMLPEERVLLRPGEHVGSALPFFLLGLYVKATLGYLVCVQTGSCEQPVFFTSRPLIP